MDKQSFSDKYIKHNTAVLCITNEESEEFLKYAYEFGFIKEEITPRNDWFEDGIVAYCLCENRYPFTFDHPNAYREEFNYDVVRFSDKPVIYVTMEDIYKKFGGVVR